MIKLLTDFDGDMTTRFLVDPYWAIISGTENPTLGVVVECAGYDGIVGMGTVRFSSVQYNGEILPLAFLDGLKVHEDFRGNGLGHRIAAWRIEQARKLYGDQCVIGTGMLFSNQASHAVASKWCREFAESAFEARFVPTLKKRPRSLAEVTVRAIENQEYEEFAHKQNAFYRDYNLYSPSSPESIGHAQQVSVQERKPYRYYAAIDQRGNLLAGAQTWARGVLKSDTINNLPAPFRLLNSIVHLVPPDMTIRDVAVNGLWYEPGHMRTARFFWEMLRWECRDQGTILAASFDSRDSTADVLSIKPWYQPRPKITIAIQAPSAIQRDQLLYSSGRV